PPAGQTCSTPSTAAFRLRALAENPGARSRDGLRHGLLANLEPGVSDHRVTPVTRQLPKRFSSIKMIVSPPITTTVYTRSCPSSTPSGTEPNFLRKPAAV